MEKIILIKRVFVFVSLLLIFNFLGMALGFGITILFSVL